MKLIVDLSDVQFTVGRPFDGTLGTSSQSVDISTYAALTGTINTGKGSSSAARSVSVAADTINSTSSIHSCRPM